MKKTLVLMAALCLAALSLTGMSQIVDSQSGQSLKSYQGNLSEKQLNAITMPMFFGRAGLSIAEAVKFKAPKADWKLEEVNVLVWDGFNGSAESVPTDRVVAIEVRDQDLNLLYRFTDSQRPYTNYMFNSTNPMFMNVELPSVPVSDEFYVCFYDRSAVAVMNEILNETTGDSYIFNRAGDEMVPAVLPIAENQTALCNWIMDVKGS